MNLMFWKKKKTVESEQANEAGTEVDSATEETLVAPTSESAPANPGLWARLKNALTSSKKNSATESSDAASEPPAEYEDAKPQDNESEVPPKKPGFLARLIALLPSRKKVKAEDESDEKTVDSKAPTRHSDNTQPVDEAEISGEPAPKSGKKLIIVLALLAPLAAGGAFFIAKALFSKPHPPEASPAKDAATEKPKTEEHAAPEPAEAGAPAEKPESDHPPVPPSTTEEANAEAPAAEKPDAPTDTPAPEAEAEAPAEDDVQAQIQAMKKQNQEMQAQIEALKKQPTPERSARPAVSPRDGVLIINGSNPRESAQGLKKVIENMNASSETKDTSKK